MRGVDRPIGGSCDVREGVYDLRSSESLYLAEAIPTDAYAYGSNYGLATVNP